MVNKAGHHTVNIKDTPRKRSAAANTVLQVKGCKIHREIQPSLLFKIKSKVVSCLWKGQFAEAIFMLQLFTRSFQGKLNH